MPAPIAYIMSAFSYLIYGWVIKWLRRGMKETSSARIAMFDISTNWTKLMTVSANASTMTNITHCYLATEVERISTQHLEETEDLTVHLLSEEEIKALLLNDEVKQSLMAAPLWKYFALYSHS